jgi:hypothetical protein
MDQRVECHSGYEYGERPTALHWGGARLEVQEILSRWRDPQGKGFRVRTTDGQVFDLYYNLLSDVWRVDTGD